MAGTDASGADEVDCRRSCCCCCSVVVAAASGCGDEGRIDGRDELDESTSGETLDNLAMTLMMRSTSSAAATQAMKETANETNLETMVVTGRRPGSTDRIRDNRRHRRRSFSKNLEQKLGRSRRVQHSCQAKFVMQRAFVIIALVRTAIRRPHGNEIRRYKEREETEM